MEVPIMPDIALAPLLGAPAVETLGWTLVHSTWQGALVAAALWLALRTLGAHAARLRYALACTALAALVAVPCATWVALQPTAPTAAPAPSTEAASAAAPGRRTAPPLVAAPLGAAAGTVEREGASRAPVLPYVVLVWALGVAVLLARLVGGWAATRRLVRRARPAPEAWRARTAALAERLGVRGPIALRLAPEALGPCVVGWLRPVVLVPLDVLSGMPVGHVEAILVHELAHVRRLDYLVNLLQSVVETLLFFHPAAWWVSARVRAEREDCCDDLAARTHGAADYARALVALEARRRAAPALALGAADGSFLRRVRRLVAPPPRAAARPSPGALVLGLVLTGALLAACTDLVTQSPPETAWTATPETEALLADLEDRRAAYHRLRAETERIVETTGVTTERMPAFRDLQDRRTQAEWRYLSSLRAALEAAPAGRVLTEADRAALVRWREGLPNRERGIERMEELIAERAEQHAAGGRTDPQVTILQGERQRIEMVRAILRLAEADDHRGASEAATPLDAVRARHAALRARSARMVGEGVHESEKPAYEALLTERRRLDRTYLAALSEALRTAPRPTELLTDDDRALVQRYAEAKRADEALSATTSGYVRFPGRLSVADEETSSTLRDVLAWIDEPVSERERLRREHHIRAYANAQAAGDASTGGGGEAVQIAVGADGAIVLAGEVVTLAELGRRAAAWRRPGAPVVSLRVAPDAEAGRVGDVVGVLRGEAVTRIRQRAAGDG